MLSQLEWCVDVAQNQLKGNIMNIDAVREWLNKQPFRPFVLKLSNGESHEVRHPENVAIGKTRIAVTWPEKEKFVHLSLIHINSIEELQPSQ